MVNFSRYSYFNRALGNEELKATRARAAELLKRDPDNPIRVHDPAIDEVWSSMNQWSKAVNSYFDYFFMGEDMKVYLAETADDPEFGDLPLAGIGFNIQQQKAPVFGFWSETYDAVMRGSRLIEGQFILFTKGPDYLKRALARAASNRKDNQVDLQDKYPVPESWREDDVNLEKYWNQTLDPSARLTQGNVFSIHPPFDLVFVFGQQNISAEDAASNNWNNTYTNDTPLYVDTNHRLTEGDSNYASRMILSGCEITDMSTTIQPNSFVMEKYSFFARDLITPRKPEKTYNPPLPYRPPNSASNSYF